MIRVDLQNLAAPHVLHGARITHGLGGGV
jgi:hypothetical protein